MHKSRCKLYAFMEPKTLETTPESRCWIIYLHYYRVELKQRFVCSLVTFCTNSLWNSGKHTNINLFNLLALHSRRLWLFEYEYQTFAHLRLAFEGNFFCFFFSPDEASLNDQKNWVKLDASTYQCLFEFPIVMKSRIVAHMCLILHNKINDKI